MEPLPWSMAPATTCCVVFAVLPVKVSSTLVPACSKKPFSIPTTIVQMLALGLTAPTVSATGAAGALAAGALVAAVGAAGALAAVGAAKAGALGAFTAGAPAVGAEQPSSRAASGASRLAPRQARDAELRPSARGRGRLCTARRPRGTDTDARI